MTEYNGVRIFADEFGRVEVERSHDGLFHFFHVCCGCHKVHDVTFYISESKTRMVSTWQLPHPTQSAKITDGLPEAHEKDLIVYELANKRAADEIEHLKWQRDLAVLDGAKILLELGDTKTEIETLRAKLEAVCEAGKDLRDTAFCDVIIALNCPRGDCDCCTCEAVGKFDAALAAAREGEK